MNDTTETTNGQHLYENFDSTDEGLREAWSLLLARYRWDTFATLTFKFPRRDPFEIVNAFNIWLFKWHCEQAVAAGQMKETRARRQDAYGRPLPDRLKRSGPFINAWKRGRMKPVYVLGIEPHKSGALHLHAVIRFNVPWTMQRTTGWRIWSDEEHEQGMKMGISRIEPPESQGDVLEYCSKYVTKGGDLVLSPSFNARCVHADNTRKLLHTA